MSKKSARPIGEVKITRGETDDESVGRGVATWRLDVAGERVRGCILRSLRDPGAIRYHVSSWRRDEHDEDTLHVGPSAVVRERDFAAAVAKAKQLMARARDAR
jgi:hypothetical protein